MIISNKLEENLLLSKLAKVAVMKLAGLVYMLPMLLKYFVFNLRRSLLRKNMQNSGSFLRASLKMGIAEDVE